MNHDEVTMGGKRSQRKGAEGEVELCKIFREHGLDCSRGGLLSFGEVPDITSLPGVHVECKRQEKQNIYEWMAQARRDADKFHDGLPAVFWRKNRRTWLVVMDLRDWMAIYLRSESDKNGKGVDQNDTQQRKSNSGPAEVQNQSGGGGDGGN